MPLINVGGTRSFYRLEGREDRPTLILSHSLGVDHGQWNMLVPDLLPHFRVLLYDIRGHGASDATPGDYSIEQLARDILAIADALNIQSFAFCGLSLGGMIGQWLGAAFPQRLTGLVLANTSPRYADPSILETRRKKILQEGMASVEETAMERFFSPEMLAANPPQIATTRRTLLSTNPVGYAGCCAAIRDMNQVSLLRQIQVPALLISGDFDVSTPWKGNGDLIAKEVPGIKVVHLPAGHLSNLERPRSFSAAVLNFLLAGPPKDGMEAALQVRRSVLGDEYVNQALAHVNDFNRDFQELITRYAWGNIWSRPGLSRNTRRLLVIAMTATAGRWEEFRLHVRAGLAKELEPCDLKEVLLQVAIYAGVPAANTAFKICSEELGK